MTIALDLEGTLVAECGEFSCERTSDLARMFLPNGIRHGARALLRDLRRAGHTLTLYTSGDHAPWKLWLWCRFARLPIQRIVTAAQVQKRALKPVPKKKPVQKAQGSPPLGTVLQVQWPPCAGFDLLLDDEPRHIEAALRAGVKGVLITNCEPDWTARVREATLRS